MKTDDIVEAQFIAVFFGLFFVFRFRQLGKFFADRTGAPSFIPRKWLTIYAQALTLFIGLFFSIVGMIKIIGLLS